MTSPRAISWCVRCPTSTATPTAGAAARRSSTGPRRRGSHARRSSNRRCSVRTNASAGIRSTSSTAASGTGSRATSTGPSRATGTGARRCPCGDAPTATTRASAAWPSSRDLAGRDLTGLDLHRPYVDEVTFGCPHDGCGASAKRQLRCSTRGSTPGRCLPRSTTSRSRASPNSRARSLPTSSARPSTRPAAGSTHCSP